MRAKAPFSRRNLKNGRDCVERGAKCWSRRHRAMNGLHIPDTPIVVDYWRLRDVPSRALFFLSHLHADHTSGLSSQWRYPIHCTPTTARLLLRKFQIRRDLIVELEVGESRLLHVECPGERVSVSVTVLDANHCPGSAMFIFVGYFGRILYTGDFRYSPAMASLPELAQSSAVDTLYLDNTYCHPSCQFPSREVATDTILQLIRENSDLTALLGLYTLGKEDLLVAIAKRLEVWVGVSPERYETLRVLEADNVFTTDIDRCFVRVQPFHIVLRRVLADSESGQPVLGILPTCIFTGEGAPPSPSHPYLKVVPYSDHSSYNELVEFVRLVKPRSVRPIVRSFSGDKTSITAHRCDMSVFSHLLDPTSATQFEIPDSIERLLSMRCHDDKPHPLGPSPPPVLKKRNSLTSANNRGRKRPATGVHYFSPTKSTESERSMPQDVDSGSHNCSDVEVIEREGGVLKQVPPAPRPVSSSRTGLFYGAVPCQPHSHRHSNSRGGGVAAVSERRRESVGGGRQGRGGGGRELPTSVTQPMWMTRLEGECGLVMGGECAGGEGGREQNGVHIDDTDNSTSGETTKKKSDKRVARDAGKESTASAESQAGRGVKRKRTADASLERGGEKKCRAHSEGRELVCQDCEPSGSRVLQARGKGSPDGELCQLSITSCFIKPLPSVPPSAQVKKRLHNKIDTLDFSNPEVVTFLNQVLDTASCMSEAPPTCFTPLLPLPEDHVKALQYLPSTLFGNDHMTHCIQSHDPSCPPVCHLHNLDAIHELLDSVFPKKL